MPNDKVPPATDVGAEPPVRPNPKDDLVASVAGVPVVAPPKDKLAWGAVTLGDPNIDVPESLSTQN